MRWDPLIGRGLSGNYMSLPHIQGGKHRCQRYGNRSPIQQTSEGWNQVANNSKCRPNNVLRQMVIRIRQAVGLDVPPKSGRATPGYAPF
jgi:hypothetical protein